MLIKKQYWNDRMVEKQKAGWLECWDNGIMGFTGNPHVPTLPIFLSLNAGPVVQYSSIPSRSRRGQNSTGSF